MSKIKIRLVKISDFASYCDFMQKTYQEWYTDEKRGLTKDLFSKEVFKSQRIQEYFRGNFKKSKKIKTWVVLNGLQIIGAATTKIHPKECELTGFYIDARFRGRGIGKKLFKKVLNFAKNSPISLEVLTSNKKTIQIYKKWGFKIDKQKGLLKRHWPEWPKGIETESIFMILLN